MARVLVIDDDYLVVAILRALLTKGGWTVVSAGSLAEARPLLPYVAAIVVDGQLPDGDGLEILQEPSVLRRRPHIVLHSGSLPAVPPGIPVVLKGEGADAILAALGPAPES